MSSNTVAIVGAGPAGLMAAEVAARGGAQVTVYERMPSAGRKFLMAGRGGLNLTHSEPPEPFLARYREAAPHLSAAIDAFSPGALRDWAHELGQLTFVGSSGRVFPQAMKASPLLRAWLRRLDTAGVRFAFRHRWTRWDGDRLTFETPNGMMTAEDGATVLALGGASWPRLGSDGAWVAPLTEVGVTVAPLRPSNMGVLTEWSAHMREKFAGQPLKRIALTFGGRTVRGEAIVTANGLEGGAIYALSARLRGAIVASGEAMLNIALRPDIAEAELVKRLSAPRGKQSLSTFLRKAISLSPVEIALLHEVTAAGEPLSARSPAALAHLVNDIPLRLTGIAPLARAISTAGGVSFAELDAHFMLRNRPGVFVAGEMLDWEAPTGGYLLQASFATGAAAAHGALAWLFRA